MRVTRHGVHLGTRRGGRRATSSFNRRRARFSSAPPTTKRRASSTATCTKTQRSTCRSNSGFCRRCKEPHGNSPIPRSESFLERQPYLPLERSVRGKQREGPFRT